MELVLVSGLKGGGSETGRLVEEIKLVDSGLWLAACRQTEDGGCRRPLRKGILPRPLCGNQTSPFGLISACFPAVMTDVTFLFSGLPPKESIVTGTLCKTFLWCLL